MRLRMSSVLFAASSISAACLFPSALAVASDDGARQAQPGCTCPQSGRSTKPKLAAIPPPLDLADEIAVLESVQLALTRVADGSSYVWHRSHGRLSGVVRPTSSFKDARGQVCRHLTVVLNSLDTTKRTEAIACRLDNGIWQIDG